MRTPKSYSPWRVWVAAATVLAAAGPAPAFYWTLKPQSSVFLPADETKPGNPPYPSAEPIPIPGGDLPIPGPGGPPPPPPPGSVPEPATGVAGLIGLAALAARRWGRK